MNIIYMENLINYTKAYETKERYPRDVQQQIKLYSADKHSNKTRVIGSYSYKIDENIASDIDLFEEVKRTNYDDIVIFFCKSIQKVIATIHKKKNQIFNELKCGINHMFKGVDYGHCSNNTYYVNDSYFTLMESYYYNNLIDQNELFTIMEIRDTHPKSQLEYEQIHQLMRNRFILRWTIKEVMQGYKVLQTGLNNTFKYYLTDAVQEKSNINIEGLYIANGKYTECSNFFFLEYCDSNNNIIIINLPTGLISQHDKDDYFKETLKTSMYTLLYSELNFNPFKCIKRLFSYARHYKDEHLLKITYDIINSQIGNLYYLCTQFKTIIKVINKSGYKKINQKVLYNQIDKIRWNMQSIIIDQTNFKHILGYLDDFLDNDMDLNETGKELAEDLDEYYNSILTAYINPLSMEFLKDNNLYPLPTQYMPSIKPF